MLFMRLRVQIVHWNIRRSFHMRSVAALRKHTTKSSCIFQFIELRPEKIVETNIQLVSEPAKVIVPHTHFVRVSFRIYLFTWVMDNAYAYIPTLWMHTHSTIYSYSSSALLLYSADHNQPNLHKIYRQRNICMHFIFKTHTKSMRQFRVYLLVRWYLRISRV